MASDKDFMKIALIEAEYAFNMGEVPVGAVLVYDSKIISRAHNKKESFSDPTGHAEILALREAASILKKWRLSDTTLYVTKEPCIMCVGAMINARIKRLVFGCSDIKNGAVVSLFSILSKERLNHKIEVIGGVLEDESKIILRNFFQEIRAFKGTESIYE